VRWSATPPTINGKAATLATGPSGCGNLTGARAGGGGGEALLGADKLQSIPHRQTEMSPIFAAPYGPP
jgi:hypothetical protein